ncbi:MAG: sigma-70 family RNA polymerase sigma factor [Planctomycetota bacterium]
MPSPDPPPDLTWSLIARAASGDAGARAVFGTTYLPVVRAFLEQRWQRTPLAGETDDAVQEVFVECLRERGVLAKVDPSRGDLRGLLFGVARNVAARIEQRRFRRNEAPLRDSVAEATLAPDPSLSASFDREWARTLVRIAADRMRAEAGHGSEAARRRVEILQLRFGEGLPIRAIAERWQVDADTLHRALQTAREEFRRCLRQVVAEHVVRSEVDIDREVARVLDLTG